MSALATIPVALLNCNERGGNLWTRSDGRVHFIRNLGQDRWLSVCYTPDNYPSFEVELLKVSVGKFAEQLTDAYKGDRLEVMKINDFELELDNDKDVLVFRPLVQLDQTRREPKKGKK